jgi:hypothetical protein
MDEVRKTGGGVKGSVRRLHRTALHSSPLPLSRDPWGGGSPWQPPNMGRSGVPGGHHPPIQTSKPVRKRVEDINGGQK